MSLFNDNAGGAKVSISTPGPIKNIPAGAFTMAVLFKFLLFQESVEIWRGYRPDNFSNLNFYFDGDFWVGFNTWDSNIDRDPALWHWLVVTRDAVAEPARCHHGLYDPDGDHVWSHNDVNGTTSLTGVLNRISLGSETSPLVRGHLAVMAGWNAEMSDGQVESLFGNSSSEILAAEPDLFLHWPEADGVVFEDLTGGGAVVPGSQTGTWTTTDDPDNFDFSLASPNSGRVKINGVPRAVKIWNGSAWVEHPVKVHNGSEWVSAKG